MAKKLITYSEKNDVLFKKIVVDYKKFEPSTTIIVPDTHNAIVIKDGIALDTLSSGRYKIFDNKSGIFANLIDSAQTIEVIYVSKTAKLNLLWGTKDQYDMRDPVTGTSIKLGASGELEIQVCNPRKAYLELIGTNNDFDLDDLKNRIQGRLLAEVQYQIATIMQQKNLSYDRLCEVLLPVGNEILPHITKMFEHDYGLKIFSFTISRIIISSDDIAKINKARSEKASAIIQQESREYAERMDDKKFAREMDLKRLEREDYDKYLEVCRIVGWPTGKKNDSTKECPNCGVKISETAKFCPICGTEIQKVKVKCPNCGKLVTKDDLFCKNCGVKLRG